MLTLTLEQALDLPKSAILVAMYLERHGMQPVGYIAKACKLSIASVYAAFKALQKIGKHDHDHHHLKEEGTVQKAGAVLPASQTPQEVPSDPLVAQMVEEGIDAGPAARLVAAVGRERAALQLEYHAQRKAWGFHFKKGPAAGLYVAIRDNWAPPLPPPAPGLVEAEARKKAEAAPAAPVAIAPAKQTKMSRGEAIALVRRQAHSKLAPVRNAAWALAAEYGLSEDELGLPYPDTTMEDAA